MTMARAVRVQSGLSGRVDIAARFPRNLVENALEASLRVNFHAQASVAAAKLILKNFLEAEPAGARVYAVALGLTLAPLVRVHLAHVSEQMTGETTEGIVAPRLDDEVHAGIDGLKLGQPEHRLRGQVFGEPDGAFLAHGLLKRLEEIV